MTFRQDRNQNNEFLEKLLSMSEDLKEYNRDDKQELMLMYIQDRLDKSTDEYLRQIKYSADYLSTKKSKYLLRKIKNIWQQKNIEKI